MEKVYISNPCFNLTSIEEGISIGMDDDKDIDFYIKNEQVYDLIDFEKFDIELLMKKYGEIKEN